ncbi:hypothetical protein [Streptomyces sp. NPDC086787]
MRPWVSATCPAGTPTVSPRDEETRQLTASRPREPARREPSDDDIGWPK